MSRKLKFLFKAAVVLSFFYGAFLLFFLQEVSVFGDSFVNACDDRGISLPLKDPRIFVDVSDSTLTIMEGEKLVHRYDISSGSNRIIGSLKKGLDSTPLGTYKVIRKSSQESVLFTGSRFLELDYPSEENIEAAWEGGLINRIDYERFYEIKEATGIPPKDLPISKVMGLQGNYFAIRGSKSTNGAIGLSNGDIIEIFDHIPVGTPVTITR